MRKSMPPFLVSGFLVTLLGAVLLSTKAIFVKKAFLDTGIDALTLLLLRMLFSLPFYLFAAYWSGRHAKVPLSKRQWINIALLGITGYYVSSLFDFIGLKYISAGLERLILFIYPTLVVIINHVLYKQKVRSFQWLSLALTYAGILLAFLGDLFSMEQQKDIWIGSFFVVLCAITFSVYIVGSGRLIPKTGSGPFTAYAMLAATVGVLSHYVIRGNFDVFPLSPPLWFYGSGLALIATVIPSFMISYGMKTTGSNNVAIILSIGPVSTILQAYFFLGEQITWMQIAGTALVVAGIILVGWRNKN
ncbi:MAG: DMT family transporter [Chitinophagaceae bacterium]|nr:DMT family transporter [Chitinophagaceae bacterium]